MYKKRFDKLYEKGVFTFEEKQEVDSRMTTNSDGRLLGTVSPKIAFKYNMGGDILNGDLCEFVKKYCVPPLGMEFIDETFQKYGFTLGGICEGWNWFEKGKITDYAINKGRKPIEEANQEELWKMLAISSFYWEKRYSKWYDESQRKSQKLDSFINECEDLYFGYDEDGYTERTIDGVLDEVRKILKSSKKDDRINESI